LFCSTKHPKATVSITDFIASVKVINNSPEILGIIKLGCTITLTGEFRMQVAEITIDSRSAWYALFVKHQHEKKVVKLLHAKGFDAFTPLRMVPREGTLRGLAVPMLPHYVFSRFHRIQRTTILRTPSVIELAAVNNIPVQLSDEDVHTLLTLSSCDLPFNICSASINLGQHVHFSAGPLEGIDGYITNHSGHLQWMPKFANLQHSISIAVESFIEEWRPVPSATSYVRAVVNASKHGGLS
jgi:transcription antitermination factor NusG